MGCTLTQNDKITLAGCELGSETPAGWSMHIGGTQMASVLNMDEGSDTTTQTDSVEERERERKRERGEEGEKEGYRREGRSIK